MILKDVRTKMMMEEKCPYTANPLVIQLEENNGKPTKKNCATITPLIPRKLERLTLIIKRIPKV
jgi:hypothetical protein